MPAPSVPRTRPLLRASVAFVAMLLIASALPGTASAQTMGTLSEEDLLESVSASEIATTVRDLQAFGSRAFCLDKAWDAAQYVFDRLEGIGLEVSYQNFTFANHSSANVVAVLNGTDADAGVFLFGAHYDSENEEATTLELAQGLPAPGADDDASGVAALIELAGALSGVRARQTIKFVAFGAEEKGFDGTGGLRGSTHFVEIEKAAGTVYECAVVLDMVGYSGDPGNYCVIVTSEDEVPFVDEALKAVEAGDLELDLSVLMEPRIVYSDHAPFWSAGYPAVLVTERMTEFGHPDNPYYHSAHDTMDKLSGRQMENVTRCLLASALAILDQPGLDLAWASVLAAAMIVAAALVIALTISSRKHRKGDAE